jgi:hypothetical protein
MNFTQATLTKLENGYVVALQGFDILTKQQIGEQYIATTLDEAIVFLKDGKKSTPAIALQSVKKS